MASWTADEADDAPRQSRPTTLDDPPRMGPEDFGDERGDTSMTVTRAFEQGVRDRARRSVSLPGTQADRVADERAYAGLLFECFGADAQLVT